MKKPSSILAIFLVTIVLAAVSSCTDEYTDAMPARPENVYIDLDEDGTADYVITYGVALIESTAGDAAILGQITPTDNNAVLINEDTGRPFITSLEQIGNPPVAPLSWEAWRTTIVSIVNNVEGRWPLTWTPNTATDLSTYRIGLKMEPDSTVLYGWIEVDIDTSTGAISIKDQGIL